MQLEVINPENTIADEQRRQDQNRLSPNSLAISFRNIAEQSAILEEKRKRGPSPKVIKSKVGRNMKVIDNTYKRNYMDKVRTNYQAMNRSVQVFEKIHGKSNNTSIADRLNSINGTASF